MDGGSIADAGVTMDGGRGARCDSRYVTCGLPPPDCGPSELPLVLDGCWGPCVHMTACPCESDDECMDSEPCSVMGCKLGHCEHLSSAGGWDCTAPGGPPSTCQGYECVPNDCTPNCAGRQCGSDGCVGSCGACTDGSGCGADGQCRAFCGDGLPHASEGCDDGNLSNGDGCDSECRVEPGFGCSGTPSACVPRCTSTSCLADGEPCDGNVCDMALGVCMIPPEGAACSTATILSGECFRSRCVLVSCGDGATTFHEECDDANTTPGDGCTSCRIDLGFRCFGGAPSFCIPVDGSPNVGHIIFTEIMHNPGVTADDPGEYVELHNVARYTANLTGCRLSDSEGSYLFPNDTMLAAGDRLTISHGAMPGFTPDLVWGGSSSIALLNSGDDVSLTCPDGVIDQVVPDATWPVPRNGYSLSLSPLADTFGGASSNDSPANWCFSTSTFGGGDRGTPDQPNDACPPP